jgi:hypothetical protein
MTTHFLLSIHLISNLPSHYPSFRPDLLLELPSSRTLLLAHLFSIFETSSTLSRFKTHFSQSLLLKERFLLSQVLDPKYGSELVNLEPLTIEPQPHEESKESNKQSQASSKPDEQSADNYFEDTYKLNSQQLEELEKKYDKVKNDTIKVDKQFVNNVLENIYIKCVRVSFSGDL